MSHIEEPERRTLGGIRECSYPECRTLLDEAVCLTIWRDPRGNTAYLCDPHARRVAQMLAICADGRDPLTLADIRDTVERAQALIDHAYDETPYTHSRVHTWLYQASEELRAAAAALDCVPGAEHEAEKTERHVEVERLHRQAMGHTDNALQAQRVGDIETALSHFREAYGLEFSAASLWVETLNAEPTRSVLLRSAASLAMDCGLVREAERLIGTALAGDPPPEIAKELRALLAADALAHDEQDRRTADTGGE